MADPHRSQNRMTLFSSTTALARLMMNARRGPGERPSDIDERIRRLLVAANTVPYYRQQMEQARYDPRRDFSGAADLSILRITPKSDVQADPSAFVKEGTAVSSAYFSDQSSGSTGIPLTVYRSAPERAIQLAKWIRVLIFNGYRPTDRVLSFTAPSRIPQSRSLLQRAGLLRRLAISYHSSPEASADALARYRPNVVYGIATLILMLAEEIDRRGVTPPPIKLLVAGGEVIDAHVRNRCREVFGVDVTETYGSVELGVMAYQHRQESGLRLIEDCTHFEFLDEHGNPARPGQLARLVVTDLHGRLMPFIRYDQGDLAVYNVRENARGGRVRVIERIVGREDDVAVLSDGRVLTYLDFAGIMSLYPGIRRFRVTQRAADAFLVEIATSPDHYTAMRTGLASRLRALSGFPLGFDLRRVEEIGPDKSGKIRKLVSEIGGVEVSRVRWVPSERQHHSA